MPNFRKLDGTGRNKFNIGAASQGPSLNNVSGVLEVKNFDGTGLEIVRAKDPVGLDDLVTRRFYEDRESYLLTCARNANLTNSYLRGVNGVPLNTSPFVIPSNSLLLSIGVATQSVETYDVEIYLNTDIVSPPIVGNSIFVFNVVSSQNSNFDLTVPASINSGDTLAVFVRGTNINRPNVTLSLRKV